MRILSQRLPSPPQPPVKSGQFKFLSLRTPNRFFFFLKSIYCLSSLNIGTCIMFLVFMWCDIWFQLKSCNHLCNLSSQWSIFKESLSTHQTITFFMCYWLIGLRKWYIDQAKPTIIPNFIIAKILGFWVYSSLDVTLLNWYVGNLKGDWLQNQMLLETTPYIFKYIHRDKFLRGDLKFLRDSNRI